MTPDPAGMGAADQADPQSLNRYAYVGNDPINRSDPSGLCYVGDCFTGGDGGDVYGRGFGIDFGFGCFWLLCGLDWLPPDMTRGVGGTVIERGDPGTVFGIMPGENSINFPGGNPLDLLPLPLGCAAGVALGGIAGGMSSCMPADASCDFGVCNFASGPIPWPTSVGGALTGLLGGLLSAGAALLEVHSETTKNDKCIERYGGEKNFCSKTYWDPDPESWKRKQYGKCVARAQARFSNCLRGLDDPGPLDPADPSWSDQ